MFRSVINQYDYNTLGKCLRVKCCKAANGFIYEYFIKLKYRPDQTLCDILLQALHNPDVDERLTYLEEIVLAA